MTEFDSNKLTATDTAAESVFNKAAEEAELESRLAASLERLKEPSVAGDALETSLIRLEISRTLVALDRGAEAWPPAREAFDIFMQVEDWANAAEACDILFQTEQDGALSALGQGIWLAVTCPINPELTVTLLHHVVDETPADSDGAAVAAASALFLTDLRAQGKERDSLKFFAGQILGNVAHRHSGVDSQEAFDLWMERLELNDPDKFLPRLRNVVDVLVQDDWWFDREALQARLPVN